MEYLADCWDYVKNRGVISMLGQAPKDWYGRDHGQDWGNYNKEEYWVHKIRHVTFIWDLVPASAETAPEQLRVAMIKRHKSTHIIVIPKLLTPEWLEQFFKSCDVLFDIPIGCSFWPRFKFEPMTIGIMLPFWSHSPWILRRFLKMLYAARHIPGVLPKKELAAGNLLCKLLVVTRTFPAMPDDVVRKVLFLENKMGIQIKEACYNVEEKGHEERMEIN